MTAISATRRADGTTPARRLPRAYLVAAAVLPLLLLALYVALLNRASAPLGAQIGQPAPNFALADLNGKPLRLADLAGRPVVVNFWASWCGPCVEEFPLLQRAQAAHASDGLAVVGIIYHDQSEPARAFMQRMGATWPAAMDPGGKVASAYGIYGPPETFFIGRDGQVVGRQIGQFSARDLDQQIADVLAKE